MTWLYDDSQHSLHIGIWCKYPSLISYLWRVQWDYCLLGAFSYQPSSYPLFYVSSIFRVAVNWNRHLIALHVGYGSQCLGVVVRLSGRFLDVQVPRIDSAALLDVGAAGIHPLVDFAASHPMIHAACHMSFDGKKVSTCAVAVACAVAAVVLASDVAAVVWNRSCDFAVSWQK